jgi:iron complex outermembrane receptor protein
VEAIMHRARRFLTGALLAASASTARAQAPPDDAVAKALPHVTESVVVQAIRADAETPVTKSDLDKEEIARLNYGQEMPFLLKQTPSLTQYSDTGLAAGYSYIYLRGVQQTRINMTLDGAPLNEPEDSALYFVDFGDFASALDSVQIQRGVGTSTVGTASFAGSINFASLDFREARDIGAELGAGSFGSNRAALRYASGPLPEGLALYGRAAYKETDGFKEHSGVRQRSLFYGVSRQGERSLFKLFGFAGREASQLAYLATDRETLERDLRFNALGADERDRFGQNFVQGQFTRFLGASTTIAAQAYSNWAGGWYTIRDGADLLQYNLNWRLLGSLATFNHARGRFTLTAGAHVNDFRSHHSRDLVGGGHDYDNHGFKSEVNAFVKLGYDPGRWHLYGDTQVRHARFRYEGALPLGSASWSFFNPKAGVRFALTPTWSVYGSCGRATREPARADMLSGEDDATVFHDLHAVLPERVLDFEAGSEYRKPGLRLAANVYAMEFTNEIALTGELSAIGLPLRRNVDRSYRRGLELELHFEPWKQLRLTHTANLSRGRIRTWTQFYDVYDAAGSFVESVSRNYRDVSPLLTPAVTANLALDWMPDPAVSLGVSGRYVSRSFLDNTSDARLATPSFFNLDASASASLRRWARKFEPRLRVQVSNVLDNRRIWPSGYSYLFFARDAAGHDTPDGTAYYYPQATRGVFVALELKL